jgi:hypothetical protein
MMVRAIICVTGICLALNFLAIPVHYSGDHSALFARFPGHLEIFSVNADNLLITS